MTIPADVLRELAIGVGESLEVEVNDGAMIATPSRRQIRRRMSLAELLEGVTPALAHRMVEESAVLHGGPSVGRELP